MKYITKFIVSAYNKNLKMYRGGGLMTPWTITVVEPFIVLFVLFLFFGGKLNSIHPNISNDYVLLLLIVIFIVGFPSNTKYEQMIKSKHANKDYKKLDPLVVWLIYIALYISIMYFAS